MYNNTKFLNLNQMNYRQGNHGNKVVGQQKGR